MTSAVAPVSRARCSVGRASRKRSSAVARRQALGAAPKTRLRVPKGGDEVRLRGAIQTANPSTSPSYATDVHALHGRDG